MSIRVAINGFGRTGRAAFRAARERELDIEWAGINDLMDQQTLIHLLAHDSVYGAFPGSIEVTADGIRVDGADIPVSAETDPAALPWDELGVDVVIESTGRLRQRERGRPAPGSRRTQGDHLGPRERLAGRRRHRRPRRQLRRGLRPRRARRDLQRVVYDELSRTRRQGAARGVRRPARLDDDDPRLHRRPAAARLPAQGPASRPRRRAEHGSDHDRRRPRARPRHPRAGGATGRVRGARAHADGLPRGPHRRGRAAHDRGGGQRAIAARADHRTASTASCAYSEDPLVSTDIVASLLLVDLRRRA